MAKDRPQNTLPEEAWSLGKPVERNMIDTKTPAWTGWRFCAPWPFCRPCSVQPAVRRQDQEAYEKVYDTPEARRQLLLRYGLLKEEH